MSTLNIKIPKKLHPFTAPSRYKVAYGGRGSAKSWSIAQLLVVVAYSKPTRILCCREVQKSIEASSHQLLSDTIYRLGLGDQFDIQRTTIHCKNGSQFLFEGLKSNINKIKSMEGIDICWVEEAEAVTKTSWETLIPTIRKPDSEIWVSFNPYDELDETYQRFVVDTPDDCALVNINWPDNPWFPEELAKEKDALYAKDATMGDWIYGGKPLANADGAYWAKHIKIDQIKDFAIDPALPVYTYWDLGISDDMTIWFAQYQGAEIRLIHCYSNSGEGLAHYINYLHDFRDKHQIVYEGHYAPHDINVRELGTGKSRLETARSMGVAFRESPKMPVQDGINAARFLLPRCWFNESMTKDGVKALKSYRREFDEVKGVFKNNPLHNWASHYADAFRYLAVSQKRPQRSMPHQAQVKVNLW